MVKPGTLTKLKSAMKRWPSIAKLGRTSSSVSVATVSDSGAEGENISSELHTVYVAFSRYVLLSQTRTTLNIREDHLSEPTEGT
ncbi:uncharacterized protein LOC111494314 isoform X3 [Cucurbita maxima]|uniref:Uncharacterized protein LOC111494314 isoform X3 n=1 Tax=Cucurbita maxima TaxID=3661 RepID=A0A6J1KLB4_CUCMA|nr:uncharacterized protein LOC111494314 isoform X3 [Cucurbita maxima]